MAKKKATPLCKCKDARIVIDCRTETTETQRCNRCGANRLAPLARAKREPAALANISTR